jgi:hypothetical protein
LILAEFEELRLTVNLVDNASQGLAGLRQQIQQLTQSAGQMTQAVGTAGTGLQNFGRQTQQVSQQTRELNTHLRQLALSGAEVGRGVGQMSAALQGLRGLPQIAGGLVQMQQGLRGINESMLTLGATSRLAVVGLGTVGVAVLGIGALFAAAMISAFKFSREIREMSNTAKTMGMSFADLKNATDQAEKFGMSAATVIQNMAGLQKLQTALYSRGSPERAGLIAKGVEPEFLDQFARMTDKVERDNFVRQKLRDVRAARRAEGATDIQAQGIMNLLAGEFGVDPRIADQPEQKPLTADRKARLDELEAQAARVEAIWNKITEDAGQLKLAFMEVVGPTLITTLNEIKSLMETFDRWSKSVAATWKGIKETAENIAGLFGGASGSGTILPPSQQRQPRDLAEQLAMGMRPISFGGGGRDENDAVDIIRQGTLAALIQFSAYSAGGGGAAGGGFMNANLSSGGGTPAPGSNAARTPGRGPSGFGGKEFPDVGGGAPPSGGGGTQIAPPGEAGQYRPKYSLGKADLSDETARIIAGEAQQNPRSIDAVINNMFNRLGTKGYGPSGNLEEVATAPGQYEAAWRFRGQKYSRERLDYIKDRIRAIASGAVPDITGGSNEFRASGYSGPWFRKNAGAPVIGGNRFGYNPRGGRGPYSPYMGSDLDRSTVDRANGGQITATGKLDVNVNAPPGTSVEASGTGPFTNVETTRQTQMLPAMIGPNAAAW